MDPAAPGGSVQEPSDGEASSLAVGWWIVRGHMALDATAVFCFVCFCFTCCHVFDAWLHSPSACCCVKTFSMQPAYFCCACGIRCGAVVRACDEHNGADACHVADQSEAPCVSCLLLHRLCWLQYVAGGRLSVEDVAPHLTPASLLRSFVVDLAHVLG